MESTRGTPHHRRRPAWWASIVALLAVLALVAAACGDDDDDDDTTDTTAAPADTTAATAATGDTTADTATGDTTDATTDATTADTADEGAAGSVAGCEDAYTDPTDLSPDREPARCEPGAPAAVPLAERAEITVTLGAPQSEFSAIIQIADSMGEFEAENIDVTIENIPASEAWPLLAQGEVDAVWSGPEAAFHNLIAQDFDIKWVMGNYFPAEESRTGLWASSASGITEISQLAGGSLASIIGAGSVIMYPIGQTLTDAGVSLSDVDIQTIPPAEILTALQNGAVDAAWILDPGWAALVDDPGYTFLAGQPPAEPIGGLGFGPTLLEENREAGVAFVRALIRTINTYFVGDYKADADLVAAIAEVQALDSTDALLSIPSLVWDWEIRDGTSTRVQGYFIELESVDYDEPIPETDTIDRAFYLEATGHADAG